MNKEELNCLARKSDYFWYEGFFHFSFNKGVEVGNKLSSLVRSIKSLLTRRMFCRGVCSLAAFNFRWKAKPQPLDSGDPQERRLFRAWSPLGEETLFRLDSWVK